MHHVVALEEARCAYEQIIQSGCESHVIWRIAWWTCVGAWRIIGDCSRRFHLEMWSPGPAWYWEMWNVGKGRRHWNYFDRCNRNICSQILLLLWGCWMHVPVWLQLKTAGVLMSRSFEVDGIQMCLWRIAWWRCMQNVGAWRNAWRVFNKMPSQDVVTWNAILGGCAMHGHGKEALNHFEQMCEGVQQNDIAFFVSCQLVAM